ncbi:short-chain fatty acid transporter [Psychroflexus sp. YR1-1]|uniref:Short-chain fatty acid transporter n=1 Tax=Psychroflexus aurantiacus TaxID=2709310 RepID=A0A6B3QZM7_9FLAO|nr:TIGR00366 family protein [Psychroflexus aurantiacus]NEV93649.1 short-chain fatty acid transporter [Psychroflexus aurantiacus]
MIARLELFFAKFLPSPFTLSILLTLVTLVSAVCFGDFSGEANQVVSTFHAWQSGLWNQELLVFGYQMMLILVLGHVLVLSSPVNKLLEFITQGAVDTKRAVVLVSVSTMLMGFFNWGLGLIFGAILARKIGEKSARENLNINYPLIAALGYSGMMIWHGGISGSAPLKAAEEGHLHSIMNKIPSGLPAEISTSETIFSSSNLIIFGIILLVVPLIFRAIKRRSNSKYEVSSLYTFSPSKSVETPDRVNFKEESAHILERNNLLTLGFGGLITLCFFVVYGEDLLRLNITPNLLNFLMLGLGVLFHKSISQYLGSLAEAIKGASGILIQFPLYFGIIGVMKESGLAVSFAQFFVDISTEATLPIFTFISSGIVNIFVPSGGGQWAIQGPIALESASKLGVPIPKIIMALSYGDQVTNMLQPFWALPLLAITKLKASDIFPFTFLLFIIGSVIFITGLLIF